MKSRRRVESARSLVAFLIIFLGLKPQIDRIRDVYDKGCPNLVNFSIDGL
jgi:hypothetical protein